MTNHEAPQTGQYEPSQEELRDIFEAIDDAVKSPAQSRPTRSAPNVPGTTLITTMRLHELDAQEVLADATARAIKLQVIDPAMPGYHDQVITVDCARGNSESDMVQIDYYSLYKIISHGNVKYSLSKTPAELEEKSKMFELPSVAVQEEGYIYEMPVSESSSLESEFHQDFTRIGEADMDMLRRLAFVCGS